MAKFFMFGKYSADSVKAISPERTKKAGELIQKLGGKVQSIHALLGEHDLVLIADFPSAPEAMKASLGLNKMTGISFTTSLALPVDEFDQLFS